MATSFVTFPVLKDKALLEILKNYPDMSDVTLNDLRNPEPRWWCQEVLFTLLKNCKWMHFDEKEFTSALQGVPAANRQLKFYQMLLVYWSEIGQMAMVKPPIELLDLLKPTSARVMRILSGFVNFDVFIANLQDSDEDRFGQILKNIEESEEHNEQNQKRIAEFEELVERKREEAARNAQTRLELRCAADAADTAVKNETYALNNLTAAIEEKRDTVDAIQTKINDYDRKTGVAQSELDRLQEFHIPDVQSFLQKPGEHRRRLDDLRKKSAEYAKTHADMMDMIRAYQQIDEEIRAILPAWERTIKAGKETEEVMAQLNELEAETEQVQSERKKVSEERNYAATVRHTQQQRHRRPPASPVSEMNGAKRVDAENIEDDGEIRGRREEANALMQLLTQKERLRQGFYAKSRELDAAYHNDRDRLCSNHDQYMDYIRGMMNELMKEGLLPVQTRPDEDEENEETVA